MRIPPHRSPSRAGLTVIELMITLVVLVVAVGATLGSISSFVVLGDSTRETTIAYLAAQRTLEEMRAQRFADLFALYNGTDADDPAGLLEIPGGDFRVGGLTPQEDDLDGLAGRVLFPTPAGAPGTLREDLDEPAFGLPGDLNADTETDALDHSGDYTILPVRVRVEWRSRSGNRFVELQTVMRER